MTTAPSDAAEQALPLPGSESAPAWHRDACDSCGETSRVVAIIVPRGHIRQCSKCLYKAVLHETNRQQVEDGTATVLPTPVGGQALLPCEWCPPGGISVTWARPHRWAPTREPLWLCDDCARRGRPRPWES